MEIKALGTVSPWPKGNMNCPGFLVTDGENRIMLDCGNGSSSLLDKYKELKNLTVIISHYHPDHYGDIFALGNASFVLNKYGFLDERVKILLPEEYEKIKTSQYITTIGDKIEDYDYIRNTKHEHYFSFDTFNDASVIQIGGIKVTFYKTIHALNAHAIKLESSDGVLVYSSDTDYDEGLSDFASNADVFICESSFLKDQIKGKSHHLYAHEAGILAKKANVKDLYLYHTFTEEIKEKYLNEAKEEFEQSHILNEGDVISLSRKM